VLLRGRQGSAGRGISGVVLFIAGLPLFVAKFLALAMPPLKKEIQRYETEGAPLAALTVSLFGLLPPIISLELLDQTECDIAALFTYAALVLFFFVSLLLRYDFISASEPEDT
jgi:hypothetical protein